MWVLEPNSGLVFSFSIASIKHCDGDSFWNEGLIWGSGFQRVRVFNGALEVAGTRQPEQQPRDQEAHPKDTGNGGSLWQPLSLTP